MGNRRYVLRRLAVIAGALGLLWTGPVLAQKKSIFDPEDSPAPRAAEPPAPRPPAAEPPAVEAPAAADPRAPLPAGAALTGAEHLVRQVFEADYARPAPADRQALARKLLAEAVGAKDNPAELYVVLREARDQALAGRDAASAASAVRRLHEVFAINPADEMDDWTKVAAVSRSPEAAKSLAQGYAAVCDAAATAGQYDLAIKAASQARTAALGSRDAALLAVAERRLKHAKELQLDYKAYLEAMVKLQALPDDPQASLAAGRFLCFGRGHWFQGLNHLARASDPAVAAAARNDLGGAPGAKEQVELADAWWAAAEAQPPDSLARQCMLERARQWYAAAKDASGGLTRDKINVRLAAVRDPVIRLPTEEPRTAAPPQANAGGAPPPQPSAAVSTGPAGANSPPLAQDRTKAAAAKPARERPGEVREELPSNIDEFVFHRSIVFDRQPEPYVIRGRVSPADEAPSGVEVRVEPGAQVRGGTIDLRRKGFLKVEGAPDQPAVLRGVRIVQGLGAKMTAKYAVFDSCTFVKGGAWMARYSSKWTFDSCLLYKCNIPKVTEVNFGLQVRNCTLVSMTLPELENRRPKEGEGDFDHLAVLRKGWRLIEDVRFIDCAVPPTVFWCAVRSDYLYCRFVPGEAFDSPGEAETVAYVADTVGPPPQAVYARPAPRRAAMVIKAAEGPFDAFRFARLPLAEVAADAVMKRYYGSVVAQVQVMAGARPEKVETPQQNPAARHAAYDGVLAVSFKGGSLAVYVNAQKVHESDGVGVRKIPARLSPGDWVVLRVNSPYAYRNARCAMTDRKKAVIFAVAASDVHVREVPDAAAAVAADYSDAPATEAARPDDVQQQTWLSAAPDVGQWIQAPKRGVTYDLAFRVPGAK